MKTSVLFRASSAVALLARVGYCVDFFVRQDPSACTFGGMTKLCDPVGDKDGMCAYASDVGLLWCCDPHDEYCWGKTQACKGNRGGMDQIYCEKGGATWCCNKKYESCTDVENQINVCVPKTFKNPVADGPVSLAPAPSTSGSATTSTASSQVSSTMSTITRSRETTDPSGASTNPQGTTTLITTPTTNGLGVVVSGSTSASNTSHPQKKPLTVGAASGIVLGALSGIALLFFTLSLLNKRRGKLKASGGGEVEGQEIIRNRTWSDKETFVGAEVRSYTVTKWDSQIGARTGGGPGLESAGNRASVQETAIVVSEVSELEAEVPVSEMPAGSARIQGSDIGSTSTTAQP